MRLLIEQVSSCEVRYMQSCAPLCKRCCSGSQQCVVSYQCEVLEGIALAIIQDSPEPHAEQLHCYSCEGCYSVVCLQHKL